MTSVPSNHRLEPPPVQNNKKAQSEHLEAWLNSLLLQLAVDDMVRVHWLRLLKHCMTAPERVPTNKWRDQAAEIISKLEQNHFYKAALGWIAEPSTDLNLARGLAWSVGLCTDPAVCRALGNIVVKSICLDEEHECIKQDTAVACVKALGENLAPEAISVLAEIGSLEGNPQMQSVIENAIKRAARRAGLADDDLQEIAVPTFGLQSDGKLRADVDEYVAEIDVSDGRRVTLRWLERDNGTAFNAAPRRTRFSRPKLLKDLRLKRTAIGKMLTVQRHRMENFFLTGRELNYSTWLRMYVHQPLIGAVAKKLIWRFSSSMETTSGVWQENRLIGWDNQPVPEIGAKTKVSLWHPLHSDLQTVLSWRCWLEDHSIVQPFKQAFREVYLLTPVEKKPEIIRCGLHPTSCYSIHFGRSAGLVVGTTPLFLIPTCTGALQNQLSRILSSGSRLNCTCNCHGLRIQTSPPTMCSLVMSASLIRVDIRNGSMRSPQLSFQKQCATLAHLSQ
jgi:hypothetical protein